LGRAAAHLALLVVLIIFWGGRHFDFSPAEVASEITRPQEARSFAISLGGTATAVSAGVQPYHRASDEAQIVRQPKPHTAIPARPRLEIMTYVVQAGDNIESIAAKFGLEPTTVMWSNPAIEKAPDLLNIGQELTILPTDGVYHTVEEGDTLVDLAESYKVEVKEILECPFNDLSSRDDLTAGMKLIVPGGSKPYERRTVTTYAGPVPEDAVGGEDFRWPSSGYISQGYWYGHRAIDVANATGTAVLAAEAGYVSFAGWTDIGYGYLVVLDHGNGYQTYYAHLSDFYVVEGQAVAAGDVIAAMGNTGNSTGPHLHFEIRYDQYPTNPLIYLP
jgi:murein DD-endopeptidase MepM/ murein hydrolase activator NlpD